MAHAQEQGADEILGEATGTGSEIVERLPLGGESAIELAAREIPGRNREYFQGGRDEQDAHYRANESADDPAPVQPCSRRRRRINELSS